MKGGRRRLLAPFLALVLGAVVAGLGLELALRAAPGLVPLALLVEFDEGIRGDIARRLDLPLQANRVCLPSAERFDGGPELCWLRPNVVHHTLLDDVDRRYGGVDVERPDALGFCNPKEKVERGRAEVVALGDSFTWCAAVEPEQTWVAVLERIAEVSTYAVATPGIGPYAQLELLRRFGLGFEPRTVVLMVYEGNDFRDARKHQEHLRETAGAPPEGSAEEDGAGSPLRSSYAWNLIAAAVEVTEDRLEEPDVNLRYDVALGGERVPINVTNDDLDEVKNARLWQEGAVGFEVLADALDAFARLGEAHGFRPVVAYVPAAYTAYAESVEFEDPAVGRTMQAFSDAQRSWWAEATRRRGLPFWDATPGLRAAVRERDLAYFPANRHLTPEGHRIVAEIVAPRLAAGTEPAAPAKSAAVAPRPQ